MTQIRWWPGVTLAVLALAVSAIRAEEKKVGITKTPKCCDEKPAVSASKCGSKNGACTHCAKHGDRSKKERDISRRLEAPIKSLDFEDTPLFEVLEHLQKSTGINIIVDKPALAEAGIAITAPVTMRLEMVALRSALNLILHHLNLTYVVADDVLMVTTEEGAAGKNVTKLYSVVDLILPTVPPNPCPGFLSKAYHVFPTSGGEPVSETTPSTAEETLIKLITHTIQPASWSNMGGQGTLEYFPLGMAIVVNQKATVHEQIEELLQALRRLRDETNPPSPPVAFAAMPPLPVMAAEPLPQPSLIPPPPAPASVAPQECSAAAQSVYLIPPPPAPASVAPGYYQPQQTYPAPSYPCPSCCPPVPVYQFSAHPECVPTDAASWKMRAVTEDGKSQLEISSAGQCCATCESMVVKVPGCGAIKFFAADKQVQVTGRCVKAAADCLTGTGKPGSIRMQGHVRLKWDKGDLSAHVTADQVVVGLADGHLEIKPGTSSSSSPAKTAEADHEQIFHFWTGFFK